MGKDYKNTVKEKLKPKRYFAELAEYGFLDDFIKTYLKDKYETDKGFQDEMKEIIFQYSKSVSPEIEALYLKNLTNILNYFLTRTEKWKTQKQ